MNFEPITTKDNDRYLTYLGKCKEIPADLAPAMLWGYCELAPCVRCYEDGLCWQKITEHGRTFYYPPLGDWDTTDWKAIFEKNVKEGDCFDYVPEYLKKIWEKEFPGHFEVSTNRDKWDYIYNLEEAFEGTDDQKRMCKKFLEKYKAEVSLITKDNVKEIYDFAMKSSIIIKESHKGDDLTELEEDDFSMKRVLNHWEEFETIEGIVVRIDGKIGSFWIWDVINDMTFTLYNKNDYGYKGISDFAYKEMCRINLSNKRKTYNYCNDAGIKGLRQAKLERKPINLLEKYQMTWKE